MVLYFFNSASSLVLYILPNYAYDILLISEKSRKALFSNNLASHPTKVCISAVANLVSKVEYTTQCDKDGKVFGYYNDKKANCELGVVSSYPNF